MKRDGFTLIELALSLAIIGIIIGGSFQVAKMVQERNRISEAKEQIISAKDAILGFATEWVDLPTVAEFTTDLSPVTGTQMPMHYFVDSALANNIDICSFNTTNLTVVDNATTPPRAINNLAFVLASASANYNMQTDVNTSSTPNRVNIYDPSVKIDDNILFPNIDRPSDRYDDIVTWVTLVELQQNILCNKKPLRIVNENLPSTYENLTYLATLVIDGNYTVPTASSCTFTPLPTYSDFSYNPTTYTISSSSTSRPSGTVEVHCTFTADGRTVSRPFVITVNPSSGGGSSESCIIDVTGSGEHNDPCINDNECKSCICLPSHKCSN